MMFLLFQGKPGLPGPVGLHGAPGLPGPRGEKVGYSLNPSFRGEGDRKSRAGLWEGTLGCPSIPGIHWLRSGPNISRGNFSPPVLLRKGKSGKDGCSEISIPEDSVLPLQGMAGIGIPGTAGTKGEEGEQVGWEVCIKILQCLQSLLQYLGFPWNPVVPDGKLRIWV